MGKDRDKEIQEIIKEGIEAAGNKAKASRMMNDSLKRLEELLKIPKAQLTRMKDYLHYRGRGWGESSLDPSDGTPFPDRVSPCFRRMALIINDCRTLRSLELLKVYMEDFEKLSGYRLVPVEDFKSRQPLIPEELKDTLDEGMEIASSYQSDICGSANKLRGLAPTAESLGISLKSKYKHIMEQGYKKLHGKDVEGTEERLVEESVLTKNSSDTLRSISSEQRGGRE